MCGLIIHERRCIRAHPNIPELKGILWSTAISKTPTLDEAVIASVLTFTRAEHGNPGAWSISLRYVLVQG